MTNDPKVPATRVATLVAVPLALLAGFVAFQILKPSAPKVQSTAPVQVPARQLDERQATVCRALIAQLPQQVRDRQRRPVTDGVAQNAAFGDPAIIVACGVAAPKYQPTDTVYPLNSVCWWADLSGTRWITIDREVPVEITVPRGYDPPAQWVISFSDVIAANVVGVEAPWGCTGS